MNGASPRQGTFVSETLRSLARWLRRLGALACIGCPAWLVACSSAGRGEGVDAANVPPELRGDYAIFAHRCSKCHSLARPLGSGITDDDFWREYVLRMRRQPGSGIAPSDEDPILRFLHYYSTIQRRSHDAGAEDDH